MNYYGAPSMNNTVLPSDEGNQEENFSTLPNQESSSPYSSPSFSNYQGMPSTTISPQGSSIPKYSHGGEVYRRGMEDVYMSPHEISIMDKLQGDKNNYDKDGVKNYSKLWHLMNHPHLLRAGWEGHYRELPQNSYAAGGHVDDAPEGRFGDTKRVRMPKKMADMLDHILRHTGKHPTRNPKTGHREYFGLQGFFNGMGQHLGMNPPPSRPYSPIVQTQPTVNPPMAQSMNPQMQQPSSGMGAPMQQTPSQNVPFSERLKNLPQATPMKRFYQTQAYNVESPF